MPDSIDITPEDAALVKRINRLYQIGLTTEEIADVLNDDGIPNDLFHKLNPTAPPKPVSP